MFDISNIFKLIWTTFEMSLSILFIFFYAAMTTKLKVCGISAELEHRAVED